MADTVYTGKDLAEHFNRYERLKRVGLSLVADHSGQVFKRRGSAPISLRDVAINKEVPQDQGLKGETFYYLARS